MGRFISKDPYGGSITDPYSQHSYQYAHGNPVRYTDPTGYMSWAETGAVLALGTIIASVSASVAYVGTKYVTGQITAGDVYGLFGDWVAGYSNGVTSGISADIYSAYTGQVYQPKDNFLFGAGNVAGIATSFLVGLKVPIQYGAKIGQASFWATYQVVTTGYGAGQGIAGLADGKWEFSDAFNLLNLLPLGAPLLGTVKGIAGAKAANSSGAKGVFDSFAEWAVNGLKKVVCKITGKCFEAGTEVLTADGTKKIEEIQVGDWVLSANPVTGDLERKQVTDTFIRHTDTLVDLFIDGEVISVTGEHPFWTPDKGWVEAKDLSVGSLVLTDDGRVVDVDRVGTRVGEFTVYNFSVEGFHSYFVSDLGILVHNAGINYGTPTNPPMGPSITMDQAVDLATQHVGGTGRIVTSGSGGFQFVVRTVDNNGQPITRIARFDINPSSPHVQEYGPHLNLEVQNASGNTIPSPYSNYAKGLILQVEPNRLVKFSITSDGEVSIQGDINMMSVIKDNIVDFSEHTNVESHMHIEYFEGHPYLDENSVPTIINFLH